MRISDWSSDVCSSDLAAHRLAPDPFAVHVIAERLVAARGIGFDEYDRKADRLAGGGPDANVAAVILAQHRLGRRGGSLPHRHRDADALHPRRVDLRPQRREIGADAGAARPAVRLIEGAHPLPHRALIAPPPIELPRNP